MAAIPPRPKSELVGYIVTALVVAHIVALMAFLIWFNAQPHPHQGPPGFGPGWTCERIDGEQEVCSRAK